MAKTTQLAWRCGNKVTEPTTSNDIARWKWADFVIMVVVVIYTIRPLLLLLLYNNTVPYCRLRVFWRFGCFVANHGVGPVSTHRPLASLDAHSPPWQPIWRSDDGVWSLLAHSYALVYKYHNINGFLGFVTRYSFVLCLLVAVAVFGTAVG